MASPRSSEESVATFVDDEDRLLDDPCRPSLITISEAGHPFAIPWNRQHQSLLVGLESSQMQEPDGPWKKSSPFDIESMKMSVMLSDTQGGTATFRDALSTQSGSTSEHLSASLGLTIGYPFLNASVSAKYDRDLLDSHSNIRASRNASCRLGRVILESSPRFSLETVALLEGLNGPQEFRKHFGDYYVCGYELGADTGATLSASTQAREERESLELTVSVKVLFVEASTTATKTDYTFDSSSSLVFNGYSTLSPRPVSFTVCARSEKQLEDLKKISIEFLRRAETLDADARGALEKLGLSNRQRLTPLACANICKTGLVVQLLVAPYRRLAEYVKIVPY